MAKKQRGAAPVSDALSKTVVRDPISGEVLTLNLPHEDPQTAREIAENYFAEHIEYPHKAVVICDDGEIFPGTPNGVNHAANYCAANKLVKSDDEPGYTIVKKD